MTSDDQRSPKNFNPFLNIPRKKLEAVITKLKDQLSDDEGVLTPEGGKLVDAIQRYYVANIPADYWLRDMRNFQGSKVLSTAYEGVVKCIDDSYSDGVRICFAGQHGVGKTMTCACILKRVVETGRYDALYVNLTDIVNLMASQSAEKLDARKLLLSVDFLVIDEFDDRFMGTDNAADLFGRILEPVLRARIQNQLPLLLCTNSPNVVSSFTGSLRASIQSLMRVVRIVPVLDKDHR